MEGEGPRVQRGPQPSCPAAAKKKMPALSGTFQKEPQLVSRGPEANGDGQGLPAEREAGDGGVPRSRGQMCSHPDRALQTCDVLR